MPVWGSVPFARCWFLRPSWLRRRVDGASRSQAAGNTSATRPGGCTVLGSTPFVTCHVSGSTPSLTLDTSVKQLKAWRVPAPARPSTEEDNGLTRVTR